MNWLGEEHIFSCIHCVTAALDDWDQIPLQDDDYFACFLVS